MNHKDKYKIIVIILLNFVATAVTFAFLIRGKFSSNYGLEYLGLQMSAVCLILSKKDPEIEKIYHKIKASITPFLVLNIIVDIIFIINSIRMYPHFFWWQNFQ